MKVLDFYQDDRTSERWYPQDIGDTYTLMRCDHFGHVKLAAFKMNGDELDFSKPHKRFPITEAADPWMRDNNIGLPQKFICSETRRILAEKGGQV